MLTGEAIATEIVRALVGSIGLIASVPITTGLAVAVVGALPRRRPEPDGTSHVEPDPVLEDKGRAAPVPLRPRRPGTTSGRRSASSDRPGTTRHRDVTDRVLAIRPMASEGLHESAEKLSAETIDYHRAMVSLMEELEAVDWYNQRVDATDDEGLAAVLAHNRDEEKEHAAMTLEWLRRRDPKLDQQLRTYLFSDGPITEVEEEAEGLTMTRSFSGRGQPGSGS